jgi:tRNA U34 2-thiouridine synthase MnmA/TrmU
MKNLKIPICYVLFSGGLDSRLALKIMQEQQYTNKDLDNKDIEKNVSKKLDNKHTDLAFQARVKCEDKSISIENENYNQNKQQHKNLTHTDGLHQKFRIIALTYKLPFGSGCCQPDCSFNFTQVQGIEHKIIDCNQGKLFKKYLKIVSKPKFGHGSGINPCIDCRIFILNETKKILKPGDFIVTGEVLGERPMSQHKKAMLTIDEETKLKGKILRPLSAKLLETTEPEKNNLVNREKLFNISGRSRKPQIALANHYHISYPTPAGGCLLCEQVFSERLHDLFSRKQLNNITHTDVDLLKIGRHFFFPKFKVIVGRNHKENLLLEGLANKKTDKVFTLKSLPGPSVLLQGKINEESIEKAKELLLKFSKNKDEIVEK